MRKNGLVDAVVPQASNYSVFSENFLVKPKTKYSVTTEVIAIEGNPFSAVFDIIFRDENNDKISGQHIPLNSFSGIRKEISRVFITPAKCAFVNFGYRINDDTPTQSSCHFKLLSPDDISLAEIGKDPFYQIVSDTNNSDHAKIEYLTAEQEDALERNIVWIFGHKRSGTTWLSHQLLSYQTHTMNEPHFGRQINNFTGGIEGNYKTTEMDSDGKKPHYLFSNQYKDTWLYFLRKLILNRVHAQFRDLEHRIIIKEPNSSQAADILAECLPNSRIIVILRDGRDAIDSAIDLRGKWAEADRKRRGLVQKQQPLSPDARINIIKGECRSWNTMMRSIMRAMATHSKERTVIIRYEDLRTNTNEILKQLYNFIDVPIDESRLDEIVEKYSFDKIPKSQKGSGKFYRSATPGKWAESFSEEEKELIQQIIGDMLDKLGYKDGEILPVDKIKPLQINKGSIGPSLESERKLSTSFELTAEQEDALERNIVWIFGHRKSGRKLANHLASSDGILSIVEPRIGRFINQFTNNHTEYYQNTLLEENGAEPDYFFCYKYASVLFYCLRKLILYRAYAQFQDLDHKIVIEETYGNIAADIIAKSLPNSKMIAILRNGEAIVDGIIQDSTLHRIQRRLSTAQGRVGAIKFECRKWNTMLRSITLACAKRSQPDNRIIIRYEDLRTNTNEILKQLYNFIDVPIDENEMEKIVNKKNFLVDDEEPDAWKKRLSKQEQQIIHDMMHQTFEEIEQLKNIQPN